MLVFVVLGGLGNIWGSLIAAAALTDPARGTARRSHDYRMLIYAIVLIFVMLATNNSAGQGVLPETSAPSPRQC